MRWHICKKRKGVFETAERRMFAKTIVLSDAFLDMPMGARCLYMTLGMVADDDGFVNSPKSVMRQIGASEDDMKILLAKRYILLFEDGVIVIKHWRINNYLQKDRYKETVYLEDKDRLTIDQNGAYTMTEKPCIHSSVYTPVYTQDRIGKDSIDKVSTNILSDSVAEVISYLNEKAGTKYRANAKGTSKHVEARLNDGYSVDDLKKVIDNKVADWKGTNMEQYLRPETLFSQSHTESYLNQKVVQKQEQPQRKGSYFVPHQGSLSYAEYIAMSHPVEDDEDDDIDLFQAGIGQKAQ